MKFVAIISKIVTKYFTVWLILCSMLAFFFPSTLKHQGNWITNMLCIIMLGMGLTMKIEDFKLIFSRPRDVAIGVILRYAIMPFVGFCVAKIMELPPALSAGLILVGCCPSGTASNVICFLARGDVALSVTVSSFNILLAPILLPPVFLLFAGQYVQVDALAIFLDTIKIVLAPIFIGVLLRFFYPKFVERIMVIIPSVTIIIMIWVIAIVVAVSANKLASVAIIAFIAVAIHNGLGLILGYGTSKVIGMEENKARAICFEVGIEMSGLAVVLAMAHLDPLAAVPGAIFSVWHNLTGGLIAGYWAKRPTIFNQS
jgi:Predicted Na+-dependent transporter